jgi:hypothetical protein
MSLRVKRGIPQQLFHHIIALTASKRAVMLSLSKYGGQASAHESSTGSD